MNKTSLAVITIVSEFSFQIKHPLIRHYYTITLIVGRVGMLANWPWKIKHLLSKEELELKSRLY